jgi:hypothetical protein
MTVTIHGVGICNCTCRTLRELVTTLYKSLSRTQQCSHQSRISLRCLEPSSNGGPSPSLWARFPYLYPSGTELLSSTLLSSTLLSSTLLSSTLLSSTLLSSTLLSSTLLSSTLRVPCVITSARTTTQITAFKNYFNLGSYMTVT